MIAPRTHRFSVEDYHRMAEAGILKEDDRVELIEGEIVAMSPIGSHHTAVVKRLIATLTRQLGDRAIVGAQDPILLPGVSEPLPDIVVLKPREDFYAEAHPGPEDILLLIEVAESSSLEFDREVKLPLYARAGVREVWIANLVDHRLETYRRPLNGRYAEEAAFRGEEPAVSEARPQVTLRAGELAL